MNAKTVGILILLLVLGVGTTFGQTCANLYCESFQLRDQCEGGNPLPDGVTVTIYWDANQNGRDGADEMLEVGDCLTCANYNSFVLNGEMMMGMPGTFIVDPLLCFLSAVPQPPVFYLFTPIPNSLDCWTSETFRIEDGLNDYQICDWTCGPCLITPGDVQGLQASQNTCHEIIVSWNDTPLAEGYQVYRDGAMISTVGTTIFEDVSPNGNLPPFCHQYSVTAFNEAGSGPAGDVVQGCYDPTHPAGIAGLHASDNLCGIVELTWDRVYDADFIEISGPVTVEDTISGDATSYIDTPPPGLLTQYYFRAFNSCGYSPGAEAIGRAGNLITPVSGLSASTNHDDRITVHWGDVSSESGYEILRSEEIHAPQFEVIATTSEDVTTYYDYTAVPGRDYLYRVRAFAEDCGAGAPSVSVRGRRVEVEPIVFGEVIVTTNISGVMSAEAADLDADGDMDVVAAGMFANKVAWYENNGSWGFTEHELITGWRGARAVDVGDIDSDGELDIVAVSRFENSLIWWNKVEWGYWMRPISTSVMGASDVEVENINHGGEKEIVTTAAVGGDVSIWHYNGDAQFTRQIFGSNLPGARSTSAHWIDPSTNGMVVTMAAAESGAMIQWRSWTSYQQDIFGYAEGVTACGSTQINTEADSMSDVFYCTDEGVFGWWERDSNDPHVISSLIESPRDVTYALVDADARYDLLLASGHEISWWRNTPNRFYRNVICDNLPQASVVRGLDADSDGDADVLCAGDNEIRFYLSTLNDEMHNSALVKQPELDDNRISSLPREFELLANYPNPFNAVTNIQFALPEASDVKLAVFDITGRLVTTLANGSYAAGFHTVTFDANTLSSGVYFYRLEAGEFVDTRKMVLLK